MLTLKISSFCCWIKKVYSNQYIKIRDNYNKPTCGMARFHFAYLCFNHLHFTHLNFNPLPTSPSDVRKTHFYSKSEHNTDQKHKPTLLFLTSPRNMKIPVDTTFCIWYCNSAASVNLDEQRVVWGTKILVRN